ncbi:hypothetical protein [Rhizobium sp. AN80A]|uniref:hypothetical protein n=1 Tax=Rhizobium sp. AN80A TaxID=3040673 RepID=UPI0024B37E0C|nr:hypothetical protein [Rhizobium sp. AN80A]
MTRLATASTLIACLALLSACNTTDALTPLVDIGETSGSIRSTPVTQGEVERMAGTPRRGQTFSSPPREGGYHPAYVEQDARPGSGAPPTTMQAQAYALDGQTEQPRASAAIESQPLSEPVSEPASEPVSNAQAEEQDIADAEAKDKVAEPKRTAMLAPSGGSSVRFLPIIGAPVQAVTPLSRQLGAEARSHGLAIKSSNDNSSAYILKGYLSAFTDSGKVTVVYVWDVLDNSGARLHRIQGQESVPSEAQDPWAVVPASVMQQIASKTISEFSSWRDARGG